MPKYPVYTETQARELLRYLPEGTGYWKEPAAFHNQIFMESLTYCYMRTVAEGEVRGHLPPGSTAVIAGMVEGRITRGFENDKLVVIAIEVSK